MTELDIVQAMAVHEYHKQERGQGANLSYQTPTQKVTGNENTLSLFLDILAVNGSHSGQIYVPTVPLLHIQESSGNMIIQHYKMQSVLGCFGAPLHMLFKGGIAMRCMDFIYLSHFSQAQGYQSSFLMCSYVYLYT